MRLEIDPEQVRAVFAKFKDRSAFSESRKLYEQGKLPVEMIQAMTFRPEILEAFGQMSKGVYPDGLLERALKEKVILKASMLNSCQFCVNSHRTIMRNLGIPQDQIDQLEAPRSLTERERLALDYTEAVMRDSNRVGDELFAELTARFSSEEIVELTFLIGYINMLNLFNNALQVTYRGDYEAGGS
ncbi:MAG: carboxymuconolactone decarboxylase family protein [Candidatus Bipolaricaulia bacterium]